MVISLQTFVQSFWIHSAPWGGDGGCCDSFLFTSLSLLRCLSAPSSMVYLTLPFNEGHPPCKYHIKHIGNGSAERFPGRKVTAERHHYSLLPSAAALQEGPRERQRHPLINARWNVRHPHTPAFALTGALTSMMLPLSTFILALAERAVHTKSQQPGKAAAFDD